MARIIDKWINTYCLKLFIYLLAMGGGYSKAQTKKLVKKQRKTCHS
jgi:hypothetical protein